MKNFENYLTEKEGKEPYKMIAFYNTGEIRRDIKEPNTMQILELLKKECSKIGCTFHHIDFVGTYIEKKGNKTFLQAFEIDDKTGEYIKIDVDNPNSKAGNYQKPIEIKGFELSKTNCFHMVFNIKNYSKMKMKSFGKHR